MDDVEFLAVSVGIVVPELANNLGHTGQFNSHMASGKTGMKLGIFRIGNLVSKIAR